MMLQHRSASCAFAAAISILALPAFSVESAKTKRGKQLVDTHDCHGCHTPMKMGPNGPEPDMTRALSGHPESMVMPPPPKLDGPWNWAGAATVTAFAGPWGVSYAINLTPDPETGIGKVEGKRVRAGDQDGQASRHLGVSRPIAPPMPWPAYRNLPESDLKAIFAYLKSLPPFATRCPSTSLRRRASARHSLRRR